MIELCRLLLPLLFLFCLGCSSAKSYVVLLPTEGGAAGEVTVTTSGGTAVLNRAWQMTEIEDRETAPSKPVSVGEERGREGEVAEVVAALPPAPVEFVLFFRFNSAQLLPDSHDLLSHIARSIRERQPAELILVGHTDTLADEAYNYRLGLTRARAVLELLRAGGALPERATVSSRGEKDPLVATPDGTPEPRNRRVRVTVR